MSHHDESKPHETAVSKIKLVLLELLTEKDIRHITMTEIAEAAHVSRGTLYLHYEDKYDIFEEIVQDHKEGLRKSIFESYKDVDYISLDDRSLKVHPTLSYVGKHRSFFQTMMDPNKMPYVNFHSFFLQVFNKEIMLTPMRERLTPEWIDLYVHYRTLYTYAIILYWMNEGMESTAEEISREFWELVADKRFYWIFGKAGSTVQSEEHTDRRILRTRQALQESLIELILEKKDYGTVTISDITRRSNIRRATFYDHYESKEELFKATIHKACRDLIRFFTVEGEPDELSVEQSEARLVELFAYLTRHTSVVHFILGNYGIPDPIPEILHELSSFYLEQSVEIQAGKPMYAYYVSGLLVGLVLYRLQEGKVYPPAVIAKSFLQFLDLKKYKINLL